MPSAVLPNPCCTEALCPALPCRARRTRATPALALDMGTYVRWLPTSMLSPRNSVVEAVAQHDAGEVCWGRVGGRGERRRASWLCSERQHVRVSGCQGVRVAGRQGGRVAGRQGVRVSGHQGIRVAGWQVAGIQRGEEPLPLPPHQPTCTFPAQV